MKQYFLGLLGSILLSASLHAKLEVETHTAGEAGFLVNSHLILGEKEAILVDAQFTRSEAKRVVEFVRKSQKKLTTIFITHGHPDHYFGLEIVTAAFPKARVIARLEVIEDIEKTAQGKLDYWKTIYKDDLADHFIVPQPFSGKTLTLEGEEIELLEMDPAESEHATVAYVPSTGALLTGDLVYNAVHLWLLEDRPEGWLKNLEKLSKIEGVRTVYSGHGPGHGEVGGSELIKLNQEYIRVFLKLTDGSLTKEAALLELKRLFPTYRLPIIAELSIGARVK